MEFHKVMEMENKLLTSSFYRCSVYTEITVSIPKILLCGNASKLTLFWEQRRKTNPELGAAGAHLVRPVSLLANVQKSVICLNCVNICYLIGQLFNWVSDKERWQFLTSFLVANINGYRSYRKKSACFVSTSDVQMLGHFQHSMAHGREEEDRHQFSSYHSSAVEPV